MYVENCFLGAKSIGRTIEQRLWEQGITHWEGFEPACEGIGPTRAERIESFIEAGERALDNGRPEFFAQRFPSDCRWRLYESFREQACFFDIETTGLDHRTSVVTTVTLHQNGETKTLVRGDNLTSENLQAAFEAAGLLVTFNGARFDIPFLESSFDCSLDHPHIDLMPTARKVGLSGGLSEVEQELGISRELPDVDGREAVRLWHEHERGVDGALERLIDYNQEDTVNMVPVLESIVEELDNQLFPDGQESRH
ncbi:ribonuclease H-like domain-containing protein [Halovenus rubra]|uniref:Ribonuclease H-like domain-containing protein n=2 Tax=Halovenus rubra TaxID=869890 RepID=A0ABD5X8D2_9EURY